MWKSQRCVSPRYKRHAPSLAGPFIGLRLPIDRFVCKVMSQDKDEQSQRQVLAALNGSGPYAHPALAADMARALGVMSAVPK